MTAEPWLHDLRDASNSAAAVVQALRLLPHPEGGYYRETWRDRPADGGRGVGTAILFLLAAGEVSQWHRVDADELWIWQGGAALRLEVSDGAAVRPITLGPLLGEAHMLHGLVPRHAWQSARSLGDWTLVTCTVTPAFHFKGFEMAPRGWRPG